MDTGSNKTYSNMKKIMSYIMGAIAMMSAMMMGGCSDFEPTGYQEVPSLPRVTDLKASLEGFDVSLTWTLPTSGPEVTGIRILTDGNNSTAVTLEGPVSEYIIKGQPMETERLYTVKVLYEDQYMSTGESVKCTMPLIDLADVSELKTSVSGRTVSLSWTLPQADNLTGVRILRNGDEKSAILLPADATSFEFKGQPMDQELTYTVQAMYADFYPAKGVSAKAVVPYIAPKMGFLLLASDYSQLPDDDERAAAAWFADQPNAVFVSTSDIASLQPDEMPVLWIMVDRVGLPMGWKNLPGGLSSDATIQALKGYSAKGGSLYLSSMATQLTVPLGYCAADMAPEVYGNGDGGQGTDVWTINPHLGWDFRNGSDQGYYDRSSHPVYKGLTLEDPNNWGMTGLPLIGPGQREDHNCLWDCNRYGKGKYADVIKNFEMVTNSQVLATWGHVRDHCVAGLVEFNADSSRGRCIANGLAAYEWNQNTGANIYQKNIIGLTTNILEYLK